jgi:hypothetical protein
MKEANEVKTQDVTKRGIGAVKGGKVWVVFAATLSVLTWSAVVGTQPVDAAGECTTTICAQAKIFARGVCAAHQSVLVEFTCPSNNGASADDFAFLCSNLYAEQDDCNNFYNHS